MTKYESSYAPAVDLMAEAVLAHEWSQPFHLAVISPSSTRCQAAHRMLSSMLILGLNAKVPGTSSRVRLVARGLWRTEFTDGSKIVSYVAASEVLRGLSMDGILLVPGDQPMSEEFLGPLPLRLSSAEPGWEARIWRA